MSVSTVVARENRLRSMPITGVMPEPAVTSSSFSGMRLRQHELALGLLELDHLATAGLVHEVVGDDSVGDRLDGEADAAIGAGPVGQRVGAPQTHSLDLDADPDVLAGHVAGPVLAGLDHDRRGIGGLGVHRDDPAAELGSRAQRVEHVEDVVQVQGSDRRLGDVAQAVAQAAARR